MSFLISLSFSIFVLTAYIHGVHPAYEYEESVNTAFNDGKYSELITLCEQGLDIRPNSITMLNLCGQSLFLLSKYDESEKLFLKLLQIANLQNAPKIQALAYNNMGEIYRVKKQWDSAKAFYKKAINENTNNPHRLAVNLYNLAKLYKDQGSLEMASDTFRKVLNIKTASTKLNSLVYNELGLMHELKDEYKLAEEFYKEALIGIEKENTGFYLGIVHGNLGRLYLLNKNYDSALANLEKALEYGRKSKDDYGLIKRLRHLSVYYVIYQDYKKAAFYLEESISIKNKLGKNVEKDKMVLSYLKGNK